MTGRLSNSSHPNYEPPPSEHSPVQTERMIGRCEAHGAFDGYALPGADGQMMLMTQCPRCVDEAEKRRAKPKLDRDQQRLRSEKMRGLQDVAAIPRRFAEKSLDDYHATNPGQRLALGVCSGYVDSWETQCLKGGSLVLTGSCGTGKTHLACAIGNEIMARYLGTVAFGTVSSLVREIKETYRKGAVKSEKQALQQLMAPDLLIIDEVGVQHGTEYELRILFEILNDRYLDRRATILISNLTAGEMEQLLGERVMDRFRELGPVVAFDWPSYRGQLVGQA